MRPSSRSAVRTISRCPGRKASTLPGSAASASRIALAMASSIADARCALRDSGSRPGKLRPWLSITGAPRQQRRDPRAVERRRHDEQAQVRPQPVLHVERQRQSEIAVERALVELVEDHGRDAGKFGIVEDHPRQHAFGHDLDAGLRRHPAFHAHGVADRRAGLFAEQRGHAPRRGAGGQPARLEQHDPAVAQP